MKSCSRRPCAYSAVLILLFSALSSTNLFAAACCASSAVFPALISGEENFQFTVSATALRVVGDATSVGELIARADDDRESRQTLKIDAAFLLSDRWQLGASFPTVRRARSREGEAAEAAGIGDISVTLGFEALPRWEYSAWKPKGYVFFQLGLPTGTPPQQASELYRIDARGRGFVNASLGGYLLKTLRSWDVSLLAEAHHPFGRDFDNGFGTLAVHPGWGASAALSVGYSPANGPVRLGAVLSPSYEGPLVTDGALNFTAAHQTQWSSSVQIGVLVSPEWTVAANYTDQTLIGNSSNVALNRGFGVVVQTRRER